MSGPPTPSASPGHPISQSNQVEFNDSLLSSKAWKSSRYDGRQLQAAKINFVSSSDVGNNSKTPILQKYTRNIYIGNDIIGMDPINVEDDILLQFPEFSYAQSNLYITVNEDDTVTLNRLEEKQGDTSQKTGFYQAFYDDFPIGSRCKIVLNDTSIKDKLKAAYPVFFNGGQLQKLIAIVSNFGGVAGNQVVRTPRGYRTGSSGKDSISFSNNDNNLMGTEIEFYNSSIISEFYTGSLDKSTFGRFDLEAVAPIFESLFDGRDAASYKNDKRFFISMVTSRSRADVNGLIPLDGPQDDYISTGNEFDIIRTIRTGSITAGDGVSATENLAELSTIEISSLGVNLAGQGSLVFNTFPRFRLNQNYFPGGASQLQDADEITPAVFKSGSFMFTKCDDAVPSLLLPIDKKIQLLNGIGDKGFIIIPDNLHPYIKDNLTYFLTQAGIDVGGNTSTILKINPRNRLLK